MSRQRLGKVEALPELTPEGAETVELAGVLDALGDGLEMQVLAEPDDGLGERGVLRRVAHAVDKSLVDLQDVDRELSDS